MSWNLDVRPLMGGEKGATLTIRLNAEEFKAQKAFLNALNWQEVALVERGSLEQPPSAPESPVALFETGMRMVRDAWAGKAKEELFSAPLKQDGVKSELFGYLICRYCGRHRDISPGEIIPAQPVCGSCGREVEFQPRDLKAPGPAVALGEDATGGNAAPTEPTVATSTGIPAEPDGCNGEYNSLNEWCHNCPLPHPRPCEEVE